MQAWRIKHGDLEDKLDLAEAEKSKLDRHLQRSMSSLQESENSIKASILKQSMPHTKHDARYLL